MSKRGNGEGYIYRNSRGKWIARVQTGWLDNGKPKLKSFSADTRSGALIRLKEFKEKQAMVRDIDDCNSTLANCLDEWIETTKAIELKPTSLDRLRVTVRCNITPYIGHYFIEDITPSIIQSKLINKLVQNGLSYSTIKKAKDALNNYFKNCVIKRKLIFNPVDGVVMPKKSLIQNNEKEIRALSAEEIERFTQTASIYYKSVNKPVYKNGFGYLFVMYMGLRCGEALGLQYKHIDIEKRLVTVEQTVVTVNSNAGSGAKYVTYLQKSTKTESGRRKIHMCEKACSYIKKHMELHYKGNPEDFVFKTTSGNLIRTRNFERDLNAIFKRADINASGLHVLRHTMASLMLAKGIDIKYISAFLGHSSVSVTYNYYIHIIREMEDKANELMDKI